MLSVDGSLGYPGSVVLPEVKWEVGPGEFVLLVGSNGSGKTTLLRSCAGLLKPRGGTVSVRGRRASDAASKRHIGYLPDPPPLYEELTGQEHCELVERLWAGDVTAERVDELVEAMRLQPFFHQRCDALSSGTRKRLGVALALMHSPDLLLLDEPHNGLDARSAQALTTLITQVVGGGGCCVVSTHQPQRLLDLATRVTVLYESRIVYDQSPTGWDPYEWGFTDLPDDGDDD